MKIYKKLMKVCIAILMMGIILNGTLAIDYSLSSYPQPFIDENGKADNLLVVVGKNAAASDVIGQSVLLADLQTKAVSPATKEIVATSGVKIALGDPLNTEFESVMDDSEIITLKDGSVKLDNEDYDYSELIALSDEVTLETSLTSENDYNKEVYLEVGEKGAIKYYFAFDEGVKLNETDKDNQMEIKFLDKTMKIIDVEDNKFTAYVGAEYFMEQEDSVVVDEKTVTLVRVGSANAVIVDVDGVQEMIQKNDVRTVNGIEIKNEEVFYESNPTEKYPNAATLIIGKNALRTFKDGEAYIGEDKDEPLWVWNLNDLEENSATEISVNENIIESGPVLGIENDFVWNDDSDDIKGVDECIELPERYVSICFNGVTTDTYSDYTIEYEDHTDLEDVDLGTDEKTIHLYNGADDGFKVGGHKTKDIWLYFAVDKISVFYEDDNEVKFDSNITTGTTFANINYGSTKDDDLKLKVDFIVDELNLTISSISEDTIVSRWEIDGEIKGLGDNTGSNEDDELYWNNKMIGNKDEELRTKYGVIISDPSSNGDSDRIRLLIPNDQVKGVFNIKGKETTTTKTTTEEIKGAVIVNPITSASVKLAEEVDPEGKNLIIVGGVSINPLAGLTGLPGIEGYKPGEAIIKLVPNGESNWALLIAGYEAEQTRAASLAVASGKLKNIDTMEARVTTPSLSDWTKYTIESGTGIIETQGNETSSE